MPGRRAAGMVLMALVLDLAATSADSQSVEIVGYLGELGEWELAASIGGDATRSNELSGPLTMRHVGMCAQDGPEERPIVTRTRLPPGAVVTRSLALEVQVGRIPGAPGARVEVGMRSLLVWGGWREGDNMA